MDHFQECMDQQSERIDDIDKKLDGLDETTHSIDTEIKENFSNFRISFRRVIEEQRDLGEGMDEFKASVAELKAIEEKKLQFLATNKTDNALALTTGAVPVPVPSMDTGPTPGAVAAPAPVSNPDKTTTLLDRESSGQIHPTTSFNPHLPTTTVLSSSQLPPNNELPQDPLPPADTSSVLPPEHLSPNANDPDVDHLSPESATGKGKRSQGKTPTVGDRRSPRLRANSRAPSPANEGTLKQKRATEEENGGDPKRRKVMPS
jgi:hypothetical protein